MHRYLGRHDGREQPQVIDRNRVRIGLVISGFQLQRFQISIGGIGLRAADF